MGGSSWLNLAIRIGGASTILVRLQRPLPLDSSLFPHAPALMCSSSSSKQSLYLFLRHELCRLLCIGVFFWVMVHAMARALGCEFSFL